jgi:multidrug transporter EmrE-like cation transporter
MKSDFLDNIIKSRNWKVGSFNTLPIFFGTLMALVDICMMSTVKMVNNKTLSGAWGLPLAVGFYALQPLLFLKATKNEGMILANLVWNLMSNMIITLQGVFVFGESVKGLRWVAICMSIFSLALMAYTGSE